MTYGHFTLEEWEKLGGSPYFEQQGRWYRITDYHIDSLNLKRVNYQAEECDAREAERWKAEHAPQQVVEKPVAEVVPPPSPEPEEFDDDEDQEPEVKPEEFEWDSGRKPSNPDYKLETPKHPEGIPSLSVWARAHGWVGRGAIPKAVKAKYTKEFQIPHS